MGGEDMWRLWFTKLLILAALLLAAAPGSLSEDAESLPEAGAPRLERDLQDDYPDDHRPGHFDSKRVEWPGEGGLRPAALTDANDDYLDEAPRKRVRIRVPVVRKFSRQHTRTVVRRRPVSPRTQDPPLATASHTPRRIVVTRVRTLGLANSIHTDEPESFRPEPGRHKVTITRRRKIEPTSVLPSTTDKRARITKKKLIAVRPVQPTPSFAIITSGFFTAPTSEYEEEYEIEDETEEPKLEVTTTFTPELQEPPNVIDNKPDPTETSAPAEETSTRVLEESSVNDPVIITDNFFFPESEDEYSEYEDDYQVTTTTESANEPLDEDVPTTVKSPKDDENVVPSEDSVSITSETPAHEKVTTVEPKEETEETATEMVSKEDAKLEGGSTTAKPIEDSTATSEEDLSEEVDTTVQEDVSTTIHPDINEEEEEEKEQVTTEKVVETTESINETMVISVPEDQPETTTHTEKDIETTTETSIPETTVSSTESIESQIQPELTDHLSQDAEGSIEKDTESHVTTQPTETEPHDTSTEPTVQPEPKTPPTEEEEDDVQKLSVATEEEKDVQEPSVTTKPLRKEEEPTVQMIEPVTKPSTSSAVVSTDMSSSSIEIAPSFASVLPLETYQSPSPDSPTPRYLDDSEIPSVIPLGDDYTPSDAKRTSGVFEATPSLDVAKVTTSISSPTPEDIEAGLADDLYLSLSRPDFPQILPSKPTTVVDHQTKPPPELEPSTSVFYTETVVTSTRLRTYTYVVTQQNGLETKVTSSTTVRPRVTTLTLTVPVTVTVTPTVESSANAVSSVYSPVPAAGEHEVKDEEGRRFNNLATRVLPNGVEVIVAGPTPALRWENSIPQPTLTLSDAVVMMLPQDKPNEFVTKTCTTTFTYLTTITKDGTTTVSTEQQVVANTATEERHRKPGSETAAVTLEASPTLRTEIFKTTYTYLTLNTNHPNVDDALESSSKVITNTVTAPQHYLDMILEPSEAPRPETNTYLSTRMLEKTFMEDGRTRIETASDTVTQLIITESAPPLRPTSVTTTLTALDHTEESMTDVMKTYYITYTYYNTFLEKGSTVVRTNVATSTDLVLEKVPVKKPTKTALVNPTPEPIQIFATKTYLTTFTYFTTLLQAGPDGETSTTVSSRSHIVENVVTESIAPSLLNTGYMSPLLTTSHHTDSEKNVVTGSTIIFYDEEGDIDPTTTSLPQSTATVDVQKDPTIPTSLVITETSPVVSEQIAKPVGQESNVTTAVSGENGQNKRPVNQNPSDLQVSNLLSLGSLGINALGPMITAAMAGLLQGKPTMTRRNDTVPQAEAQEVTTQRSPIYIPVADFADGDIETAESQNIGTHLAKLNYIAETRHKVTSSLADGIPISPGEVITANTDVIIGKPGKMAPRPPQTFLEDKEHIGMKPPPLPVPNIPVHPVLEVLEDDRDDSESQQTIQTHNVPQIQIYPAQQVYEEHLKIPVSRPVETNPVLIPKQPQKLHPVQSSPPKRIGSKQDVLENDPLLKPPERPNVEQYVNPNSNLKEPEWSPEKSRRPWSAKDPVLFLPPHPQFDQKMDSAKPLLVKPWPTVPTEEQKRPLWAPDDPLTPGSSIGIQSSESKPTSSEPILHQVPHVIDRPTGQDLLVSIQPSQIANVVIPQGGTQALIFGDTSEPHISGQSFDDPSPYPDSDIGLGFVGIQRVEDLQKYPNGKDPAEYMVPPSPPLNFRKQEKPGPPNRPATIPLLPDHFNYERLHDKLESPVLRPSTQGHVHADILMHHRPENANLRPQGTLYSPSYVPPRGQFQKVPKPGESGNPPRRIEVATPSDNSHRYILVPKPDSGNEIGMNSNWKDKKPTRFPMNTRLRPRPPIWSTTSRPLDRPIYGERPHIRKPIHSGVQRPPPKIQNQGTFVLPHRPITNLQIHHDPPRISSTRPNDDGNQATTERQPSFRPPQIDLQDRPPHFYSDSKRPPTSTPLKPPAEYPDEHLPTGATGYNNPSNPKVKLEDSKSSVNSQNIDQTPSNSEKQLESWQTDSQTEKTLDSDIGASEYVKYANQIKVVQETQKTKGDGAASSHGNNITLNENVASGNIVIGKPVGFDQAQEQKDKPIWFNPGIPFGQKIEVTPNQGISYGPGYYTRPNDMAIVQGKPFGVYNGHEDPSQYGHKRKEPRPDSDIVQGVHATYRKPIDKHHFEVQTSTNRPHDRDDTIDLRPPAIIPHFAPEVEKPSRYPRPPTINKIETRPALYPRPETVTRPPKKKTDQQHADSKPELSGSFANNSLNHEVKANKSQAQFGSFANVNWQGATKVPDQRRDESQPIGHEFHSNKTDTVRPNFRNSSASQKPDIHFQNTIATTKPLFEKNRPKVTHPEYVPGTRIHPEYPHIITKPRPQVPGPITITSGNSKPDSRPNIKFSLPVEAIGQEVDSKTQTERPPSMLITVNNLNDKKKNDESLETAYQTHFAVEGVDKSDSKKHDTRIRPVEQSNSNVIGIEGVDVPSRDMMPPPLRPPVLNQSNKNEEEGLKPPPIPSHDVVGLSPPPVDITTTSGPTEDRFSFVTANDSGLKPPPKYIPLKEATVAPLPSVSMVPPSPRPSVARPFIVELLSQDMVPPPPATQTTRPLEIATVRPGVAVSGSIQIATAVATSHIPVIHDVESKIPIIHGTVDLPVVVDVPDLLRPVKTMITEHVSIYTVPPFDTRPVSRISIQPTPMLTTNKVIPTKSRPVQVDHIQPSRSSSTYREIEPTKSYTFDTHIPRNPVKRPEHTVFLEPSHENVLPSSRVEPTESLTPAITTSQQKDHRTTMKKDESTKVTVPQATVAKRRNETTTHELPSVVTRVDSSISKVTNVLPNNHQGKNESVIKLTKDIAASTMRKHVNGSTTTMQMKPKEVTRFQTSTVTRVETSVLGSPPTTRTLLITHTLTSTTVETVTETLLRPTSVISTITSTILQSIVTRIPGSYENVVDNDSIFVVVSDQKPPAAGAEQVEAEYDDISRDEQDPTGNEIHRVLAGGILGAPVVSLQPVSNQCAPECRASRAEICAAVEGEMRCVCRPGFARMFPDRPCKPTYTYTVRVGLDRIGHEPVNYESSMNDTASPAYRRLLGPTKDALDRTLMQSDLRDIYRGLKIAGFTPDPTKVEFHVQLSDNANETRLKEVLQKYLIGSNYSLGGTEVYASKNLEMIDAIDFDECMTEDGGPHHDCSPNAACFNLRGSYQCSCKEGWADLSDNPTYPGRLCSQAPLGCPSCNNKGHCVTNTNGQEVCECFPWHSGQRCQVNLKVLLIALVTTGAILLGLLAVCVGMACFRHPSRKRQAGDRRAMIPGTGGDTSSEGSVTDLAIPHHVPHVLPPPPQMIAPLPPTKRPARKISGKPRQPARKATMVPASVPVNDEQRDRSLTVMIPRAKYRSAPQSPQNYKSGMSTFSTEEHKLLSYLDNGTHNTGNRKQSITSMKDCKEADVQVMRTPATPTGALVSAGFQVSATVTRTMDADSTLARSCGETTVETATKVLRTTDPGDLGSTLPRSCGETTIQAPTKLLRLDLGEAGSTLARSCGETTIQPPTKVADARRSSIKDNRDNRDTRDSASEGHTMAERDLGSTLRLPAQHPPLYSPDRASDRESNFDSL
ncbi:uncharacterized protein LOC143213154 isoform X2 [Lasioglossum baleicum]|uniref:uncharacterized protein LOC143213154 isoform X2 n=1 Tax=Lasioglossum baleicum TaxID=434251 RepID=UPI003FCCAF5D